MQGIDSNMTFYFADDGVVWHLRFGFVSDLMKRRSGSNDTHDSFFEMVRGSVCCPKICPIRNIS